MLELLLVLLLLELLLLRRRCSWAALWPSHVASDSGLCLPPARLHKDFVPATIPRRYAPAAVIPSTIEHGTPFFRNPTTTSAEKYRQCPRCRVRAQVWRNADRLPNHCPRILQHVRSETHQSQESGLGHCSPLQPAGISLQPPVFGSTSRRTLATCLLALLPLF
jgi:hypothetical protein